MFLYQQDLTLLSGILPLHHQCSTSLIARFMGPTWGPSGADRSQVGHMFFPWTLLSGMHHTADKRQHIALSLWQQMTKNTQSIYDFKTLRYTLICFRNHWFFILVKINPSWGHWFLADLLKSVLVLSLLWVPQLPAECWWSFGTGLASIIFDVPYNWIPIINNCFFFWIRTNATNWPVPDFWPCQPRLLIMVFYE